MTSTTRAPAIPPAVLTIAGSDSGAGAGIQADLKTFAALGTFGTSAITAVTAQNTRGVDAVQVLRPQIVAAQIASVLADFPVRAIKTGMLGDAPTVEAVATALRDAVTLPLVVDPVTHAKRGDALIDDAGICAIIKRLLPIATVVTPNFAEAEALTGIQMNSDADMVRAGVALLALGASAAVIKGGHRAGAADDVLVTDRDVIWLRGERIHTSCTHGTGCTFSAAIAAHLALGDDLVAAVRSAKRYLTEAMRAGYVIGSGNSPVNHLFHLSTVGSGAPERIMT